MYDPALNNFNNEIAITKSFRHRRKQNKNNTFKSPFIERNLFKYCYDYNT